MQELLIETQIGGFTRANYRDRNNSLKESLFLEKPDLPYGLVTDFSLEANYRSISRYFDKKTVDYDEDAFDYAWESTKRHFLPYMQDSRTFTIEEAIAKCDASTSSGYPFKFQGMPTKDLFFANENLEKILERDWQALLKSDYRDTVIYDNIVKEEIRPIEKLESGNVRGIMTPPADHLVSGQRLFADMNAKFVGSYLQTWSAVGIPKTGGNWNRAINKLSEHEYGFAADAKAYDSTLPPELMNIARDLRMLCNPEEAERIKNYYSAVVTCWCRMPDGTVLLVYRGNKSGFVNTTYDNTIILFFLLAYSWYKATKCDKYDVMIANVSALLYGDDNTFTVSNDYIRVFNMKSLAEGCADFGVVIKDPETPPKHFSQLDFLGCKWIHSWGQWLPVMESDKLKVSMVYSEYPDDPESQAEMVLQYLQTNPFGKGFREHCLKQLEVLYTHMTRDQVAYFKDKVYTDNELINLYTGYEINASGDKEILIGRPVLNRIDQCNMSESSNAPTQVLHDNMFSKNEVNRGKEILNSKLLSPEARNWLVRAVDPFHDTTVKPCGFPDITTIGTVVQEVNRSMTISKPVGVDGLWDVHVWNWNHYACASDAQPLAPAIFKPSSGNTTSYPTGKQLPCSGIIAASGAAGARLLPNDAAQAIEMVTVQNVDVNKFMNCRSRVVGYAFEVINQTAEVYQQGLVTCYRMPQSDDRCNVILTGPNGLYLVNTGRLMSLPPGNVADALALPGSKQWEAKHGSYSVITLQGINNPISSFDNTIPVYASKSFIGSNADTTACVTSGTNTYTPNTSNFPVRFYAPYNTSGVYFTGLSPETVLQVNVKILIEAVPGPNDVFATLAQPSTQSCPEALKLYGEIVEKLPVAVPFTENPSGEWFSHVLGTIGDLAKSASAINPVFGLVGQGFGLGKMLYDNISKHMDKKINVAVHDRPKVVFPVAHPKSLAKIKDSKPDKVPSKKLRKK